MHEPGDESGLLLQGQHVTLQPFTAADIGPDYVGWLNDRELMKYSSQRFRTHSVETCRAYVASFAGSGNLFLAIRHEGRLVGTMSVYRSAVHGTADIGLMIGSGGRGLGRDAWATMLDYLLAQGTRKVTGGTLRCNLAMVKIMQACGMQPDGVRVGQELVDGQPQDILYFARFNSPC
ncbi:GNAT family N-acetyltransferase [Pseudoduganella armeniaca]|uniref:N-acetyltransferase n=1 Tax=Pseudoduganella armeniaca TaxID=2072590 RepID=A0A2R4C407_9BURK|nr:GNAT family N-acetyltransferase [Pseudoduganella armeniaca]AVR94301.1 N-acetyltransferase [Pseudoduganella armeniaca]